MNRVAHLAPHFRLHRALVGGFLAMLAGAGFLSGACGSPLVGAECRDGLTECGGVCVDTAIDPAHCGGCAISCSGAQECRAGECVGAVDGGTMDSAPPTEGGLVEDGSEGDGGLRDAREDDGPSGDGGGPDGAPGDGGNRACGAGELDCGGLCVHPDRDPDHCGACDASCPPTEVCSNGTCTPTCEPPLVDCSRQCVLLDDDADHCGRCGNVCPSGLCRDATCRGAPPGHVVIIGHDYQSTRTGINRLVGNAIFLAQRTPVEVAAFEGRADSRSIAGTNRAIAQVASATGRTWNRTVVSAVEVSTALESADVFLVYAQTSARNDQLDEDGRMWSLALRAFVDRGGVVVVLDAGGTSSGTYRVLQPAGLFFAAGTTRITGDEVAVVATTDAVALAVPVRYRAERNSVWFDTSSPAVVAEHPDGPVIIHEVISR